MSNSATSTGSITTQVTWKNRSWPAGFVAAALAQLKKQKMMDLILKEYKKRDCFVTKEEDAVIVANSERELDKTLKWQDGMKMAESLAFLVAKHMESEYVIYRTRVESESSIVYPLTPFAHYLRNGNLGAWYILLWSTPVLNWSSHAAMLVERHSMIESITYRKEVYDFLNEMGLLMTTKYWHEPIMPSTASVLASGKGESSILAILEYRSEIAKQV